MAIEVTTELLNKLIARGKDVGQCLVLLRELSEREEKAAERSEKAAQRRERAAEREEKNKREIGNCC